MEYKIEQIGIHEIKNLMEISEETFRDNFGYTTSKENMNQFIESAYDFYQLKEEIANRDSLFFFIYQKDTVLAYLKLNMNEAQTEEIAENALEIERIYVRKDYQKLGLGKALYNKAVEIAGLLGKTTIWLGVYEHNENAKAFYKNLVFKRLGVHSFFVGNDQQKDIIVGKNLEE